MYETEDFHPQAGMRSHRTLQDGHGRHYSANIETGPRSGHASGPVVPCASPEWSVVGIMEREGMSEEQAARAAGSHDQFLRDNDLWPYAPVIPPQKYLTPSRGDAQFLRIDYDQWSRDLLDASDSWWTSITDAARLYYKDKAAEVMDRIRADGDVPRYLADLLGERPMDARVVETCKAGRSRWILGLPDPATQRALPRPSWADEILPKPAPRLAAGYADDAAAHGAFSDEVDEPVLVGAGFSGSGDLPELSRHRRQRRAGEA